jgi:branched-chain amino acid aminotransferase
MHPYVHHNDRTLRYTDVRLSPGQSGLFNGWGVFTTILVHRGRPFAFDRHWRRLLSDAARVQVPFDFTADGVLAALGDVIRANRVVEGTARIYFVHNTAGAWHGHEPLPPTDLVIATGDLPRHVSPAILAVEPHGRHAAHPLAGTKVLSWVQNAWLVAHAHARGFHEAVLLNERDEVAECTAANIFAARDGVVATPPLDSGCLAGVTREILLERAAKEGPPVVEATLTLADLYAADEVFITSTSRGVLPVGRIEDHVVPRTDGPLTYQLGAAFVAYLERQTDA